MENESQETKESTNVLIGIVFIAIFIVVALLAIVIVINAITTIDSVTINGSTSNENGYLNESGYTLYYSTLPNFEVTGIEVINATSLQVLLPGNYTVVGGTIYNNTILC